MSCVTVCVCMCVAMMIEIAYQGDIGGRGVRERERERWERNGGREGEERRQI